MAHFAELDENNIVQRVIVVHNSKLVNSEGVEFEGFGVDFCKSLFGQDTIWKQTSYNTKAGEHIEGRTPLRKNYAGIGWTYNEDIDGFVPPKPYDSWLLNEDTGLWDPPVPHPPRDSDLDFRYWYWDEGTQQWLEED